MRHINNIRFPQPLQNFSEEAFWSISLDKNNCVKSISPMKAVNLFDGENWNGDWLSPMGIDLQINGGLGIAFNALHMDQLSKISELLEKLWFDGVEAICPTIVTSDIPSLRNALEVLRIARKNNKDKFCKLLGAHLEGPFLASNFKGVHESKYLAKPSLFELHKRIKGFEEDISIVTLAPELEGASEIIKKLKQIGIVIALGHSSASAQESDIAFQQGVTMITHAFNAMRGLHHRAPGPIGEATVNRTISVGLIGDGVHIHPQIAVMLQKTLPCQLFLVSDALPPYGIDQTEYWWKNQLVLINKGVCRLEDGTLAGTTLPLLEGSKRLAKWSQNASSSIWASTVSPRLALKHGKSIQDFLIGKPLQKLLRWSFQEASSELVWTRAE